MTLSSLRLTISGVRRSRPEDETCHYRERPAGRFARSFSLRIPIDEAGVSAKLVDGLLVVVLPKTVPRRIPLG